MIIRTLQDKSARPSRQGFSRLAWPAALACLFVLLVTPPAHPWGAFRGIAGVKITDTHQLILRAAYDLLQSDPAMIGFYGVPLSGGRFATLEQILQFEGVDVSLVTLSPYGPGPDAEGATLYSCHYFNPSTGKGLAPRSVADWYGRFITSIRGLSRSDEEALKGLAWSAHFLADMFVPYHLNGMPAEEAFARMNVRNFIIGPSETGPMYLIDPVPPHISEDPSMLLQSYRSGRRALSSWWREGWGVNSNFREALAIFAANNLAAAGKPVNHLDWFDPLYWNGLLTKREPPLDPVWSALSSHVSYESAAHDRFVRRGGYRRDFNTKTPYDPLWRNAPPDYAFAGKAWQAQARQVQDFTARVAARTLQKAEICWRQPEIAIQSAAESVYTMWRSAYSALHPEVEVGLDSSRPDDGLYIKLHVRNSSLEDCHHARLRLRVGKAGESAVIDNIDPIKVPIACQKLTSVGGLVRVNPNEEWTVVIEVVGVFDQTPDLQYASASAIWRPDPSRQPPLPVEEATANDLVGYYICTDPLRTYDEYHAEIWLHADGTCSGIDYVDAEPSKWPGAWSFDPKSMRFEIESRAGGVFAGSIRGNTSDFTISGHWSDGSSGTARFQRRR